MPASKYELELEAMAAPGTSHSYMLEAVGGNKMVLDVGCDTGTLGRAMMARGCTVSGVELNPVAGQEAARYLERVLIADLEGADLVVEFGQGSFDVVVFGDVLEHLRDPLTVLRQARPLLRPGGYAVISTPNIAHGDIRLALLAGRFTYTEVGILDNTHLKFFTRDSLAQFAADAGFVLAEVRRTTAPLFTTEQGVHEQDYPPELVAGLRSDPEATTYQFVVTAVPQDSTTITSAQALLVDELRTSLNQLQAAHESLVAERTSQLAELTARADGLAGEREKAVAERDRIAGERDKLAVQLADQQRRIEALTAELNQAREELRTVLNLRSVRMTRRAYEGLRQARSAVSRVRPR